MQLLNWKEIKLVNPKGNQSWIFTGRTDTEAEVPIVWPPNVKSRLIGKDPDAGKDWGQKQATKEEMFVCHHRLSGLESEKTLGDGEGPGAEHAVVPGYSKESDMAWRWNNK